LSSVQANVLIILNWPGSVCTRPRSSTEWRQGPTEVRFYSDGVADRCGLVGRVHCSNGWGAADIDNSIWWAIVSIYAQ